MPSCRFVLLPFSSLPSPTYPAPASPLPAQAAPPCLLAGVAVEAAAERVRFDPAAHSAAAAATRPPLRSVSIELPSHTRASSVGYRVTRRVLPSETSQIVARGKLHCVAWPVTRIRPASPVDDNREGFCSAILRGDPTTTRRGL